MKTNLTSHLIALLLIAFAPDPSHHALAAASPTNYYGTNLLVNGSFELPGCGGPVCQWGAGSPSPEYTTFGTTTNESKVGGKSAVITSQQPNAAYLVQFVTDLRTNTPYRLSGWIKTSNVRYSDGAIDPGARLSINPGAGMLRSTASIGTTDWQFAEVFFTSSGRADMNLFLAAHLGSDFGPTEGTAYFDDIQLAEINPLRFSSPVADRLATNGIATSLIAEVYSGASPLQFQWFKNGAPVGNATNQILSFTPAHVTDGGTYIVVVTHPVGNSITSNPALLRVLPEIPKAYYDTNLIAIVNGSFESPEEGGLLGWTAFTQTWNGSTLETTGLRKKAGARSAVITSRWPTWAELWQRIATLHPKSHYRLSGWIKTSNVVSPNAATKAAAHLEFVVPNVASYRSPIFQGTSDWQFAQVFFDFPEISYQAPLVVVRLGDDPDLAQGIAFFDDIQLAEVNPLRFSNPLEGLTATNGIPALLTVNVYAAGSPLWYQWWKDGAPISAATNQFLAVNSPRAVDVGYYFVVVSNHAGNSITSNPALVDVLPGAGSLPPAIVDLETNPAVFQRHAIAITDTLRIDDLDVGRLSGATVKITGNYIPREDYLSLSPTTGTIPYSYFLADDLTDLSSLASRVRQWWIPIDSWLSSQLSTETKSALDKYLFGGVDVVQLKQLLLQDLNAILHGPSIYDEARFARTGLRQETRRLVLMNPQGAAVQRLNQLLLEDAYPVELRRHGITGRFDPTLGTLTLTGRDTVANYQTALRSVRYLNPPSIRDGRNRTISITVTDGVASSPPVTRIISMAAVPERTEIVAWGSNGSGQATVPAGLSNAVAVAVGDNHSLALLANGSVVAWGASGTPETLVPAGLSNVVRIAAGGRQSYALKSDGTVVSWGSQSVPGDLSEVITIAAGTDHGLALRSDGTLRGWGESLPLVL